MNAEFCELDESIFGVDVEMFEIEANDDIHHEASMEDTSEDEWKRKYLEAYASIVHKKHHTKRKC
jgi:hypothetical protein